MRGDHDRNLESLPATREIALEGKRVVIVHGQRPRWLEESQTFWWTVSLGFFQPHRGLPSSLLLRFPHADVIIFGHTHRAYVRKVRGTLLFNPGGVHQWNPTTATRRLAQHPGWFEWCWLQVARHMRRYESPSVGIVDEMSWA